MVLVKNHIPFFSILLVLVICCSKGSFESPTFNTRSKSSSMGKVIAGNSVSRIDLIRILNNEGVDVKSSLDADYSLSVYPDSETATAGLPSSSEK